MDLTRLVPLRRRQWYRPDAVRRLQEMQRRMIRHLQEETPQKKHRGWLVVEPYPLNKWLVNG